MKGLPSRRFGGMTKPMLGIFLIALLGVLVWSYASRLDTVRAKGEPTPAIQPLKSQIFEPRKPLDTSGFAVVVPGVTPWPPSASLEEIMAIWKNPGSRINQKVKQALEGSNGRTLEQKLPLILMRSQLFNYEGEPAKGYEELKAARAQLEGKEAESTRWLYSIIYCQGVSALRQGENENCIMCRGESSCILPIAPSAVHTNPAGSRLAITHFTEYLKRFPEDLEVRWLLNLAHMTLGEYPEKVEPAIPGLARSLPRVRVRHRQVPRHRRACRGQPL